MNGRGGGPQTCFGGVEGTFRRACPCVKALLFTTARAAPRETPPWYARLQGEGHIRPLLCPSPGSPSGPRQRDLGPWCPAAARGARRGLTSPYYAPAVRNAVPLAPRPAKALRRHARPSRKGHNRGLLGRLFPCVPGGRFSRRTRQRVNAILFTAAHAGGPCTASAARATVLKIVQNVFVLWGKHTNVCR